MFLVTNENMGLCLYIQRLISDDFIPATNIESTKVFGSSDHATIRCSPLNIVPDNPGRNSGSGRHFVRAWPVPRIRIDILSASFVGDEGW